MYANIHHVLNARMVCARLISHRCARICPQTETEIPNLKPLQKTGAGCTLDAPHRVFTHSRAAPHHVAVWEVGWCEASFGAVLVSVVTVLVAVVVVAAVCSRRTPKAVAAGVVVPEGNVKTGVYPCARVNALYQTWCLNH